MSVDDDLLTNTFSESIEISSQVKYLLSCSVRQIFIFIAQQNERSMLMSMFLLEMILSPENFLELKSLGEAPLPKFFEQ